MYQNNFESESNIINTKTPALKVINNNLAGKIKNAGFWIADENIISSKWKKNCITSCEENCVEHFVSTSPHLLKAEPNDDGDVFISGRAIINPRMCIIRRTELLKLENGRFAGSWRVGDKEKKNSNHQPLFVCVRRYLIMFVDKNGIPLHEEPIQLTARGTFQYDFDTNYMQFRKSFMNVFCEAMKKSAVAMSDQWHAYLIFVPKLKSRIVTCSEGMNKGKKSNACHVESYEVPTLENYRELCAAYNTVANKLITDTFNKTVNWDNKYKNYDKK